MIQVKEHIYIREALKTDAATLFSWSIDQTLYEFDPKPLPKTLTEVQDALEIFTEHFNNHILKKNNVYKYYMMTYDEKLIGYINVFSFNPSEASAELGIIMGDKSYWHKQISYDCLQILMTEFMNTLHLEKVTAETLYNNDKAIALFEKLGFYYLSSRPDEDGFVILEKKLKESI